MLPNEQTLQFSQAKLKAKDCLRFTMRRSGGEVWYMVEDEIAGKFFQIGLPQYTLLSLLNGKRTVNDALMKTATLLRQNALDEQEAANLCKWTIESGLVETELSSSSSRRAEAAQKELMRKTVSWLNPISLKIPMFNPDALMTSATHFLGWLVSPIGALIWLVVVMWGGFTFLTHASEFINRRVSSFSPDDILWFVVAWLVLKLVHESAHGIVCKRFGGRVTSFGLLLLLFIPLPFVDVTSSWRFANKWSRILVSAAGMLVEVFIAAIACLIWAESNPGPLQYHAGNVMVAATLHTLLFNANPLMKFDGYYMLSDWLEIPNLSDHGRTYVKSAFKRAYFGNEIKQPVENGWRSTAVKVYGFLSIAWFFLITIGLSLAASSLLDGFGLLIAVVGLVLWFGLPIVKFIKYVFAGTKLEAPNRQWFAVAASLTCLVLAGILFLCPSPTVVSAPVVIDYEPLSIVRASAPGFANQIHVVNGQAVQEGDLLMTLENPDLKSELKSVEVDIRISQLRSQAYLEAEQISSLQLERELLASKFKRRSELQELVDTLEVRAPQDGNVLGLDLAIKAETYLQPGDEILSIGKQGEMQGIALARQQDVQWLRDHEDSHVYLKIWGRSESQFVDGEINVIDPRARDDVPHDAFAASNGGPLAVVPREQVESAGQQSNPNDGEDELMLTQPRVPIEIKLSASDAQTLWAGQTGLMYLRGREESLGGYLAANFMRFIRHNNYRTHGL
jgi:putative peptide zinc metalloprotease protein